MVTAPFPNPHKTETSLGLPLFANFQLNHGKDDVASQHPILAGEGNFPEDYPSGEAFSDVLDI